MIVQEKKLNNLFLYWLITSLILVFLIVIVGGLTRLTNSGLSITEWELIKGIFPPLNETSWNEYFNSYKKIPQYKLLNPSMTLSEFKVIFYWEYFHRILARVIGLFFLIPLIYFYFKKEIKREYLRTCSIIFLLILFQGIVGWLMVKSGLVHDVTVSHFRLSTHLTIAFIIIASIFWLIMNKINNTSKNFFKFSKINLPFLILILLIFIQIIFGAFVSGLDAGKIYQTWPMMGSNYFPDDIILKDFNILFNLENHSIVQFYHRNLAYILVIYIILLAFYIFRKQYFRLYKPLKIIFFLLFLQIILGIFTLISGLNILLALAHQISSGILMISAINLYYRHVK